MSTEHDRAVREWWELASQATVVKRGLRFAAVVGFIRLARRLNAAAISLAQEETVPARRTFDTVQDYMVETVHRMASIAGKTEDEPDHEPAVVDLTLSEVVTPEDARPQDPARPPRP